MHRFLCDKQLTPQERAAYARDDDDVFTLAIASLDEQLAEATLEVEVAKAKIDTKMEQVKDGIDGLDNLLDDVRSKSAKKYGLEWRRRELLASPAPRMNNFAMP